VSAFHKIIANVRSALEAKSEDSHAASVAHIQRPISSGARRTELIAQFTQEFERVSGQSLGLFTPTAAAGEIVKLARALEAHTVAIGRGVKLDADLIGRKLTRNRVEVIRPTPLPNADRQPLRDRIAGCDLGIIEADYAIAATGTFCIVAEAERPSSLTILPPVNLILVAADRISATLAEVIAAVGPATFSSNRVALITGPSRTADIEKMIVIGVHGPKQLYAMVLT
jgi:L-lactate dehydrogenase complex protein LldG